MGLRQADAQCCKNCYLQSACDDGNPCTTELCVAGNVRSGSSVWLFSFFSVILSQVFRACSLHSLRAPCLRLFPLYHMTVSRCPFRRFFCFSDFECGVCCRWGHCSLGSQCLPAWNESNAQFCPLPSSADDFHATCRKMACVPVYSKDVRLSMLV